MGACLPLFLLVFLPLVVAHLIQPDPYLVFISQGKITGPAVDLPAAMWGVLPLPEPQRDLLARLAALPDFGGLVTHVLRNAHAAWTRFVTSEGAPLPGGWEGPAAAAHNIALNFSTFSFFSVFFFGGEGLCMCVCACVCVRERESVCECECE